LLSSDKEGGGGGEAYWSQGQVVNHKTATAAALQCLKTAEEFTEKCLRMVAVHADAAYLNRASPPHIREGSGIKMTGDQISRTWKDGLNSPIGQQCMEESASGISLKKQT